MDAQRFAPSRDRDETTLTTSTGDTVTFYYRGTYVTQITSTSFSVNVSSSGGTQYNSQDFDEFVADVDSSVIVTALAPSTSDPVTVEVIRGETYRPSGSSELRVGGGLVWEASGSADLKFTFSPPDVIDHKVTWSFDATLPPVLFKAVIKRRS